MWMVEEMQDTEFLRLKSPFHGEREKKRMRCCNVLYWYESAALHSICDCVWVYLWKSCVFNISCPTVGTRGRCKKIFNWFVMCFLFLRLYFIFFSSLLFYFFLTSSSSSVLSNFVWLMCFVFLLRSSFHMLPLFFFSVSWYLFSAVFWSSYLSFSMRLVASLLQRCCCCCFSYWWCCGSR